MKKIICRTLHWSLLFLVLVNGAGAAQPEEKPGEAVDIAALLNDLGRTVSDFKTLKTDFVQEKEMAMFKEKLVIKGRIYLAKPTKVAWHVDSPLRYSVLITDKLIRQWDEDTNQVQEVSLAKNPIFRNVLDQLTVWFSGNYSSLIATNNVRVVTEEPLAIEFSPKDNNVAKKIIKSITISFRADRKYLQQIRIRELNGDTTTLSFTNTLINPTLDNSSFEVQGHV